MTMPRRSSIALLVFSTALFFLFLFAYYVQEDEPTSRIRTVQTPKLTAARRGGQHNNARTRSRETRDHRSSESIEHVQTTRRPFIVVKRKEKSDEIEEQGAQKLKIFDNCPLPDRNPWDPKVWALQDPDYDPFEWCTPTTKVFTKWDAINGTAIVWDLATEGVVQFRAEVECQQRCLYFKSAYKYRRGFLFDLEPPRNLDCETVEVLCNHGNESVPTYRFLHQRIVERIDLPPPPTEWRPHVLLFLLDSVAHTQSERQLSKTLNYLRRNFGIISFPWLNKVALNSRVNAMPLFFGKLITPIHRSLFELPDIVPWMEEGHSCTVPLDNLTNIFSSFARAGYRTSVSEDWSLGALYWPNCEGFHGQQAQHFFKTFVIAAESSDYNEVLYKGLCRAPYHDAIDYTSMFMEAYPGQPKFTHIWLTDTSHDVSNVLYKTDDILVSFFEKHREMLDDAFIFFMGDHGMRFGDVAMTKLGQIENNNPMLHISIPRRLREDPNNGYLWNLQMNAQRIITHFDLHATFRDLAEHLPLSNYSESEFREKLFDDNEDDGILARSLLRPIPQKEVRNCQTLPVLFDFCLCNYAKHLVSNETLVRRLGDIVTGRLNDMIRTRNVSHLCAEMQWEEALDIMEYDPPGSGVYQLILKVLPSGGLFSTQLALRGKEILGGTSFDRLDSYGEQSHCITIPDIRHICYCLDLDENAGAAMANEDAIAGDAATVPPTIPVALLDDYDDRTDEEAAE